MITVLRQQEAAGMISSQGEDSAARNVRFAAPAQQERKGKLMHDRNIHLFK